jgi:hypothetical protein
MLQQRIAQMKHKLNTRPALRRGWAPQEYTL